MLSIVKKKIDKDCWLIILVGIIIVGVYLRYQLMIGTFLDDDEFRYVKRVLDTLEGNLNPNQFSFSDYRMLIYLPQAVINYFIGFSPLKTILWPFLLSVAHIFLVYSIGTLVFDRMTGILSAFFMMIAPLNLLEIRLLPDSIISFFLSLQIYFFIKACLVKGKKQKKIYFICTIISIIFSFFIRENSFMIFPFFIVYVVLFEKNKIIYAKLLCFSLALTFALFIALNSIFKINVLNKLSQMCQLLNFDMLSLNLKQIIYLPYYKSLFQYGVLGYGMGIIFIVGMIYLIKEIEWGTQIIMLWFVTIYIYFEFISPFHFLRPLEGSYRYLTPFIAPTAILIARFIKKWIFLINNEGKINVLDLFALLAIISGVIILHKKGTFFCLIPIILFFILTLRYDIIFKRISNTKINSYTLAASKISYIIVLCFFISQSVTYTVHANKFFNKMTLNDLVVDAYDFLKDKRKGFIESNDFLIKRKLNLYINGKLLLDDSDKNELGNSYLVYIHPDYLNKSYSHKKYNISNESIRNKLNKYQLIKTIYDGLEIYEAQNFYVNPFEKCP